MKQVDRWTVEVNLFVKFEMYGGLLENKRMGFGLDDRVNYR